MNCRDCDTFLHERLDGTAADPPATVAEHLARCDRCRELHQAARLLQGGLRAAPPPAPPAGLDRRIVDRGLARRRQRQLWRYRLAVTAAAAAVVLLALLSRLLPTTPPAPPQPPTEQ